MHHFRLTILAATLLGLGANQAIAQTCPNPVTGTVNNCTVNSGALKISATGVVLDGVYISGAAIIVANDGQINNTPGSLGQGVDIGPGASLVSLTNSGTINGDDSGVRVDSSVLGTIENSGVIKGGIAGVSLTQPASVITTIENRAGGLISSDNQAIFNIGTITKLNNSGRIEGSVQAVLNDGGTINEIANQGVIASKSGVAIENTGTILQLYNSGAILSDTGAAFSQTAGSVGIFQNSGAIIGGDTGISITGGTLPFGITNSGVIAGATAIEATVVPVSVYNSGLMLGRINLAAIGSDITNAGIISLRATDAASRIEGTYTQTAAGLLNIGAASSTSYGKLVVADAAVINGGIQVTLTPNSTIAAGQTLSNVVTAGPLSGAPVIADNSLALNFRPLQTSTSLSLVAEATNMTTVTNAVTTAPSANTAATGAAGLVDATLATPALLLAPGSTQLPSGTVPVSAIDCSVAGIQRNTVTAATCAVTSAANKDQVTQAASQLVPLLSGATQLSSITTLTDIGRIVQARQEANRGLSSGDEFFGDKRVWLRPFGSWADQRERNGVSGYDATTAGLILGADAVVSENVRAGLAFAYANTDMDSSSSYVQNNAKINLYHLLGYGSYALDQDTEINFHLGFGRNSNEGSRSINLFNFAVPSRVYFNGTANADYDSKTATAGLGLGRTYRYSDKLSFTPSARADYVWIRDDGYTENSAAGLGLTVDSRTTDALIFSVDGKFGYEISKGTTLFANLGLGYDVLNDQAQVTSVFVGLPGNAFTTQGIEPSPWIFRGGAGVVANLSDAFALTVRYDAEYRSDFLNQTASAKLRWAF